MNIKKAALIAEIVGGVGVVLSLVFVGLEIRSGSAAFTEWVEADCPEAAEGP